MLKVSIIIWGLEVEKSKMAGAKMAGAASAQVWIRGSRIYLWYWSPRVSEHPHQVLGANVLGRFVGESCVCRYYGQICCYPALE